MEQSARPASRGRWEALLLQLIRFGLVGVAATAVHVTIFSALIEFAGVSPLPANFIAFAIAFLVSFGGHYYWTFHSPEARDPARVRRALRRFLVTALIGLGLNTAVVWVITGPLALPYGYAVVLMVTVVPGVLFLLGKFWAFAD